VDRTTLTFVWVSRTNKRTFLFHFGVYVTVFLFDKSNRYFWIKKLDFRFHGNDAGGMRLLRYAKVARNDRRRTHPLPLLLEGNLRHTPFLRDTPSWLKEIKFWSYEVGESEKS